MNFTIITINYNNHLGLKKTFDSVFLQSYKEFEYIVIDGGSNDGSTDIIKNQSKKIDYWVSEPDKGIYNAMNKGISKATGDYLLFLNSGDCLLDIDTIQNCLYFIKTFPNADIYYGDILVVNTKGREDFLKKFPSKLSLNYFQSNTINHQASFIRADLFKELGLYPEKNRQASDYWLFLKSLLNNKNFKYIDFPIIIYDNNGLSSTHYEIYKAEKEKIWESLVPECISKMIAESKYLNKLLNYKLIRAAININNKLQFLKN